MCICVHVCVCKFLTGTTKETFWVKLDWEVMRWAVMSKREGTLASVRCLWKRILCVTLALDRRLTVSLIVEVNTACLISGCSLTTPACKIPQMLWEIFPSDFDGAFLTYLKADLLLTVHEDCDQAVCLSVRQSVCLTHTWRNRTITVVKHWKN